MPLYAYRCDNKECNAEIEVIHPSNDCLKDNVCKKCYEGIMRKLLSTYNFKMNVIKLDVYEGGKKR